MKLRTYGAIALLVGLTACTPDEPEPDFALPEIYRIAGLDIPAAPCDVGVARTNEKRDGSYARYVSANLTLELSTVMSAYASDDLARWARGDSYSADNPWAFGEDDRRFMESGALERICRESHDPDVVMQLYAALEDYGAFNDATLQMRQGYLVPYEPGLHSS